MALKAGYKGIKKIGTGLKLTTEGTLSLDGSGPGGLVNLDDLGDVAITEPANGNILVYDSTDEEWKNAAPGSMELNDLGDVAITEPANGNILVYDSTDEEWKNTAPAADKSFSQTVNMQAGTDATFTFTDESIAYDSVIDIYAGCLSADYDTPDYKSKTLTVSNGVGTLSLVYNVPTAYALTVRVYIRR